MCGIAGYFGSGNRDDLDKMLSSIAHRGPDYKGIMQDGEIGFAHARLSVIDVSEGGRQPMWNGRQDIAIVFNGEIYNYRSLKNELNSLGFSFKSESDTEVLISLYDYFGLKMFNKIEGMYAFAIWDKRNSTLLLARDKMGEKPLFYRHNSSGVVFSSELKGVISHSDVDFKIDKEALSLYLSYDYVPAPYSIISEVQKVKPGEYILFERSSMVKERYWSPNPGVSQSISFKDAKKELELRLEQSVIDELVSDVPLGVFLSGGIDSSTIAYFASKKLGGELNTFSIGFDDKSYDESVYAKLVSKHLGTNHHHATFGSSEARETLLGLGRQLDEPLGDASIIPTLFLSKFSKEMVTVALGGDGGDELFAGYPTFQIDKFRSIFNFPGARSLINLISKSTSPDSDNFSINFKLAQFIRGGGRKPGDRHQAWLGSFLPEELSRIVLGEKSKLRPSPSQELFESFDGEYGNKILSTYMQTYLSEGVLQKVDRASMQYALEVRAPFLHPRVLDFVLSLPYKYKLNGLTTKYILKEIMRGKLPNEIIQRPKKGFGVPLAKWLSGELYGWARELLDPSILEREGLFYPKIGIELLDAHKSGLVDNRKKLWTIISFELWYRSWKK